MAKDTALLIIDMQRDFVDPGHSVQMLGARATVPTIRRVLDAFRGAGLPIFHVIRRYRADASDVEITRREAFLREGGFIVPGTSGAEIVEELQPQEGEYVIIKPRWSAFFNTELLLILNRLGVKRVVLTGTTTPNCIRTTAYDAVAYDFETIVLSDGTSSNSEDIQRSNLRDMGNIGVKIMSAAQLLEGLTVPSAEA